MIFKYLLPFSELSSPFLIVSFWSAKAFNFYEVSLTRYSLVSGTLSCIAFVIRKKENIFLSISLVAQW